MTSLPPSRVGGVVSGVVAGTSTEVITVGLDRACTTSSSPRARTSG